MRNTNTYFMMPKAMKECLNKIEFISDLAKNKAKHFINKLMKDAFEDNKDLSQFIPIPSEYFRIAYNGRYRNDFLKLLIDNGASVLSPEMKQGGNLFHQYAEIGNDNV